MSQPKQLSDDGKWWWDGQRWQPVGTSAQAPRRRRRWPWIVGGVALLLLFGTCMAAVASSGRNAPRVATTSKAPPSAAVKAPACAAPCANADGWIVEASNLRYGANPGNEFERPETGNVYVFVDVTFKNTTSREHHANPTEFVLKDASGIKHSITFVNACPFWNPVNLTAGASFGPKCLAFQAAADKPTGLTLVWTPSFLGRDHEIKLT